MERFILENEVYFQVKNIVKSLLDIDLNNYKDEQMKRRLDSWLVRSGTLNWDDYHIRIRKDDKELARFRDYLTINVSEFFRDRERWQALKTNILPELVGQTQNTATPRKGLKAWSAGCSMGAEAYTLSVILNELAPFADHRILATDLDRGILVRARQGGPYSAEEVQSMAPEQRAATFQPDGPPYFIKENIARRVEFREHNLLATPFETGFDLIVCRNVVIYFTSDTKLFLYQRFNNALRPGGILFLGATEIIPRPQDVGFKSHGISFYLKV
jgi:chemotaxis protein methyltransferase CheR